MSEYYYVAVENFLPPSYEPSTASIRVRPLAGQGIDIGTRVECDRFMMRTGFPIGTVFIIKAKSTSKEGGTPFLYTYFGWEYITIKREDAEQMIKNKKLGFYSSAIYSGMQTLRQYVKKTYKRGKAV